MVGYVDPLVQNNFEFHEAGKDLCKKINKDSPQSCVEFIKGKKIDVNDAPSKPLQLDPLKDFCKKRNLSIEKCTKTLEEIAGNINLWPCIPPLSTSELTRSTYWTIHAPGEIELVRFSPEYRQYLKEKGLTDKLKKVETVIASGKKLYSPQEVMSTFDFIREELCFHDYSVTHTGRFSYSELIKDYQALKSLKYFSK